MASVKFTTLEECENAIKVFQNYGATVPSELLAQWEELKKNTGAFTIYGELKKHVDFSDELDACVQATTQKLLNPATEEEQRTPGLLLGKIQSGKTRAFEGIIADAFEKNVDVIIVLTKGTKALSTQTIARLKKDFCFCLGRTVHGRPVIEISDILAKRRGFTIHELTDKNIIVCKKQTKNLDILDKIAKKNGFADKKILIIDDEADFASRNFIGQGEDIELARISQQIDWLVSHCLTDCYYLQVTATPYSLFLQPSQDINMGANGVIMPFRPRFTSILPIYDGYVGGDEYFEFSKDANSMYSYLHVTVSEDCQQALVKQDKRILNNAACTPKLNELRKAIMGYFVASAIRSIQQKTKDNSVFLSSCIVHVDIAKKQHSWQAEIIQKLLDDWNQAFKNNNRTMPNELGIKKLFTEAYLDFKKSFEAGLANDGKNYNGHICQELKPGVSFPERDQVRVAIEDIFSKENFVIHIVNSEGEMEALLDDTTGQLRLTHDINIFVGGQILDRGITVSNLLCFFYGRNPRTLQQDTVLQHARMYGNRPKEDMAVTRFYTTERLFSLLEKINSLDSQLREWLIDFAQSPNTTPDLSVVMSSNDAIIPCNRNKIRMSECITLKPYKRMLPVGFQTDCRTNIQAKIQGITSIIQKQPGYAAIDSSGIFEIDVDVVITLLREIKSTFVWEKCFDNSDLEWNEEEIIGAIRYATTKTTGKMLCMHKTGRNMSRVRENGAFVDAPDDGRTDLPAARDKAIDMPIIMFIQENGAKNDGWRDTPFYWPVLLLQKNLMRAIFANGVRED